MEAAGEISDLRRQHCFSCVINGVKICDYYADFSYKDKDGKLVVEDVKSIITAKNPVYRLKKKLVLALYGVDILET